MQNKREAFYSEADFQHALAWEFHQLEKTKEKEIILEKKFIFGEGKIHLDILVKGKKKNERIGIELKYKTKNDKKYKEYGLTNQGAQNLGRYDFVKDIERLEGLINKGEIIKGYAIFLTNDGAYWNDKNNNEKVLDYKFRIHVGNELKGNLTWKKVKKWQGKKRKGIKLVGSYRLNWQDWNAKENEFRYLVVKVPGRN